MNAGALLSSTLAALAIAAAAPPVLADTDAQEDSLRSRLRTLPLEFAGRIHLLPRPPDTWSMPIVRPRYPLTYYMCIARPSPRYRYHVLLPGGPDYGWVGRRIPWSRTIVSPDSAFDTIVEFWKPRFAPENLVPPDSLRIRKE